MKILMRRFLLLALIGSAISFIGCKDEEEEILPTAPTSACGGGNFCMVLDGVQKTGNATFIVLTNGGNRIYWESGSANTFEQVELDLFGNTVGSYTIDTTKATGTANIEYFAAATGVSEAVSGTITITAFDPTGAGISGTFNATTDNNKQITDGMMLNIK